MDINGAVESSWAAGADPILVDGLLARLLHGAAAGELKRESTWSLLKKRHCHRLIDAEDTDKGSACKSCRLDSVTRVPRTMGLTGQAGIPMQRLQYGGAVKVGRLPKHAPQ